MSIEVKPTNPKDIIGSGKLPIHLWPSTATAMGCLGFLDGALKYGRSNFRAVGVKASIYVDAAKRHLDAWFEGEDLDPDSGLPHLSHTLACCAILAEALAKKNLTDDRMYPTRYREFVNELTEHVGRLKLLRKDCDPKHYTIADVRKPVVFAPTTINVVVGVIIRSGKIFLQRRPLKDKNFPGYWECPDGGVEHGETDEQALARELKEELGVLTVFLPTQKPIWRGQISGYGGRHFDFRFYPVDVKGVPDALDGQPDMGWFHRNKVRGMALTPANLLAWPTIEKQFAKKRGTR